MQGVACVLQCGAVWCRLCRDEVRAVLCLLQVLHMLTVCFVCVARVLQCVAVFFSGFQCGALMLLWCALKFVAVCRIVSQSAHIYMCIYIHIYIYL